MDITKMLCSSRRHPLAIAGVVIAVDLATKTLAVTTSTPGLPLSPVENTGLAGGVISGSPEMATILMLVATAVFIGRHVRGAQSIHPAAVGLLGGGAVANLLDRLANGAVHDFVAVAPIVFNVADIAIVAGLLGHAVTTLTRREVRT